ncbi:SusD family protein [compost metagenome]
MLDNLVNTEGQSDNSYAGADNPANFQIDEFKIEATNANVSRDWRYLYGMIAKANTVIGNVRKVPDPKLTKNRKNEMIGEAAFMRAYSYFDLVRLFGDVPLITKEITAINSDNIEQIYPLLYPERVSQSMIYNQIIADLDTALAYVPATAANKGFVTKGAVNALLARVYSTKTPIDWNKVKQYSDAVIAGGYVLVPEYDFLWDNKHENSTESIFEINCEDWATGGNWGASMLIGTDWKKFNTPTNDLIKAFDAEGDVIRKSSSVLFSNVTGKWTDKYWAQTSFPFVNKYRDVSGAQNIILIRLADIMLLKAEALNELNDVNGAAAIVNIIRKRVDLTETSASDQGSMRLAIEKERRLELAFEGQRWFDLKRTNRAIAVMNAQKDGADKSLGYTLNENRLVFPIPQSERDKNNKLTQNSGY